MYKWVTHAINIGEYRSEAKGEIQGIMCQSQKLVKRIYIKKTYDSKMTEAQMTRFMEKDGTSFLDLYLLILLFVNIQLLKLFVRGTRFFNGCNFVL